ncbi:MAG: S1/P1 Nuclease [Ferruginibacter sp.]|nr:S1/P1 Nuclease [Ferruginibacter sp.]
MRYILSFSFFVFFLFKTSTSYSWGFYGHQQINYLAVFLLPPEMLVFFKPNIDFLKEHAVDPDKRRYAVADEGPRHYIDLDHYGEYPYLILPRKWKEATEVFSEDSIQAHGIVPWHIQVMQMRLTKAFKENDFAAILKNSAEIGHYIADAHVPLHTSSNHNGQLTNQRGIHGFWESRVPELLAENEFDFFIGKAGYIAYPSDFIWNRILESAKAVDSVLLYERELTRKFSADMKYAFENRNGKIISQYSSAFTIAYNDKLNGMVERRMRQSIFAVASFWYTAWVDAGQPDLGKLVNAHFSPEDLKDFDLLNASWHTVEKMIGREE